jgi:hypothetical protein
LITSIFHISNLPTPSVRAYSLVSAAADPAPPNRAPRARNDRYQALQNQLLTVPAPGVLANDRDQDNDPLTAILLTPAIHGSVSLNPDGSFTYMPGVDFLGQDIFTYRASDGSRFSMPATVRIDVKEFIPDNPPVAVDDSYLTNGPLTVSAANGLLKNDISPSGAPLAVESNSLPDFGTLTLIKDGAFSYNPETGFEGEDSFTYTVTDGQAVSSQAVVVILVDRTPPLPVDWVQPGPYGSITQINGEVLALEVQVINPPEDLDRVVFYRWDPIANQRIILSTHASEPYSTTIDTSTLPTEWTQIDAAAFDLAGNQSQLRHIWLYRPVAAIAEHIIFLPILLR